MSSVGSIVILKSVIFKTNGFQKQFVIDHAYRTGRPALVICETEDNLYHLLLTKRNSNVPDFYDYKLNTNKYDKVSGYVKFNEIHKRPLCYEEEIMRISDEDLLGVLKGLRYFQQKGFLDDNYKEIKPLINEQIRELNDKKKVYVKK